MLKFIKHHLDTIGGIDIYPVIAFVLFFTFFLFMLWYVLTADKRHIRHLEELPFEEDDKPYLIHPEHRTT